MDFIDLSNCNHNDTSLSNDKMNLFPPEIIDNSAESHFARHSKVRQTIYIVILLSLLAALGATPFIKVEISSQSRGIIRSANENSSLQSLVYGQIIWINLAENKKVFTGDTLVILNSQSLEGQINTHREKIERNKAFIHDLQMVLHYHPELVKTPKYLSEYNEYLTQLNQQKIQSEYYSTEKKVSDELFHKAVETAMDHNRIVNNYEISLKKEKLIHDQYHRQWNASLVLLQQENAELEAGITQINEEKKKYLIISPIDGKIIQCSGVQTGSFISPNQILAQISPESELLVECYVSPSDIGFFNKGMNVDFQLDAFNYNQWGTANGIVNEISGDILTINNQPVFKVRCTLNTNYLQLKNGYKGELIKGMTLTGRFTLTERTLSQLFLDKVDNWLNPKLADQQ
ncbi:HlyD family efflux transporter periplasmic adaptor subunit [Roseimarinus sediminis]|uniref:HlyD family efflux transporter periplasmic adaptor subunit n=1 Tax=Roseimarinus sediminis TaxID=1610899 RepID=UPI003D1C12CE